MFGHLKLSNYTFPGDGEMRGANLLSSDSFTFKAHFFDNVLNSFLSCLYGNLPESM